MKDHSARAVIVNVVKILSSLAKYGPRPSINWLWEPHWVLDIRVYQLGDVIVKKQAVLRNIVSVSTLDKSVGNIVSVTIVRIVNELKYCL